MDKHAWLEELAVVVNGVACTAKYAQDRMEQGIRGTHTFRVATKFGVILRPDASVTTPNDDIAHDNRVPLSKTLVDSSVERFYELFGGETPTVTSGQFPKTPKVETDVQAGYMIIRTETSVVTIEEERIALPDDDLTQFLCDQKGKIPAQILAAVRSAEATLVEYLKWFKQKEERPKTTMEAAL